MPKRLRITGLPDEVHPVVEILQQNGYDAALYAALRHDDGAVISYALTPKEKSAKKDKAPPRRPTKSAAG